MSNTRGKLPELSAQRPDIWEGLRQQTAARIGLARIGASQSTHDMLRFSLDHAQARDAVAQVLDVSAIGAQLDASGFTWEAVSSAASTRAQYLLRPDLGRRLSAVSQKRLSTLAAGRQSGAATGEDTVRVAVVLADGLSAQAVQYQAVDLLCLLRKSLPSSWCFVPVTVASQARVAIGDDIGERLRADIVVVLIGERPGLSSPDSMGVYMTYAPAVGLPDSRRNCISNVRKTGLPVEEAVAKLSWLMQSARQIQLSGVALKDRSDNELLIGPESKG